jgi:hypothetical protein
MTNGTDYLTELNTFLDSLTSLDNTCYKASSLLLRPSTDMIGMLWRLACGERHIEHTRPAHNDPIERACRRLSHK